MAVTKPFLARIPGAYAGFGKKALPEPAMSPATVLALDFLDTVVWPTQSAAPMGSMFTDLVSGADQSEVTGTATLAWAADGFTFSGMDNQTITLPDAAKLAGSTRFAVSFVLSISSQAIGTKSRIIGYFDGSDNTGPWGLYTQSNYFYVIINGQTALGFNTTRFGTGVHTFTLGWDGDYVYLYVDGVLEHTVAAASDTLVEPTDTTTPTIGESPDDEAAHYWTGKACRLLIHDLTSSSLTIAEVAAAEWSVSDGRFA